MNEEIIEEWKDIEGYEGLYQVSNLGRVKSLRDNYGNNREKILRQKKNRYGYLYVQVYKEKKMKIGIIHRLVAKAFISNSNNYSCVNHIDEDKTNNKVDNLEWCTQKYNVNFGNGIKRRVANTDWKALGKKIAERCSKQVYQYDLEGNLIKIWKSTMECGRNGFNQTNISDCCRGKQKTHKGYKWSYQLL